MSAPQPNFLPPRMPDPYAGMQPPPPPPPPYVPSPPPAKPWWEMLLRWRIPAVAAAVGLAVGAAVAGGIAEGVTIPKWQSETASLASARDDAEAQVAGLTDERDRLKSQLATTEDRATKAEEAAVQERAALDARSAELDARAAELEAAEKAVAEREVAVTKTEETIEASKIREGTWTVGRDIKPGTYVVESPVVGSCYWGIYRSGTNGDEILQNDFIMGGRPSVTLKEGQDFTTQGCGTWVPA